MSEVSYLCIVHRIPRQVPCPPLQAKPPSPPLSDSPHPLPPSPRQAPPFLNPKSSIWNIQPDQIFSWTPELRENHHRQPPLTFRHRASFFSTQNFHKMCVSKTIWASLWGLNWQEWVEWWVSWSWYAGELWQSGRHVGRVLCTTGPGDRPTQGLDETTNLSYISWYVKVKSWILIWLRKDYIHTSL